ncbi:hypothetical protein [Streptomyces longispororuber]|uniref:hypothetical protein n=1 Tax=Streptomyces longispororuber TaxID=68230 RepID=UPI0036F4F99B
MARNIKAEHGAVYRAVIVWTELPEKGGATHTKYEGPYGTPGAAQGRVTFWENFLRDAETGETRASGDVEEGVTTWTPYVPPATQRKGDRA